MKYTHYIFCLPALWLLIICHSSCGKLKCNGQNGQSPYYTSPNGTYNDINCNNSVNVSLLSLNLSSPVNIPGCTQQLTYQLKEEIDIDRTTNLKTYHDTIFINSANINPSTILTFFVFADSSRIPNSLVYSGPDTIANQPATAGQHYIVINNNAGNHLSTANIWAAVTAQPPLCMNTYQGFYSGVCEADTGKGDTTSIYKVVSRFPYSGFIRTDGYLEFLLYAPASYKFITASIATDATLSSGMMYDKNQTFITNLTNASNVSNTTGKNIVTIYSADVTQPWTRMIFTPNN